MTRLGPDPNPTTFGMDTDAGPERAAGTAFLMIRRSDAKGLQLSRLSEHAMEVVVAQGLSGWVWTSPGVRVFGPPLTNLIWIAVNMLLRTRGLLQEVLINCLGYYTFANGKLKLGVRVNSSAVEAFTEGNILFRSPQLAPLKPAFNHLTANFADEDFEFVANSISLYDIDHATLIGGGAGPLFLKSTVNLSGTASKSQAARLITVRLREELGGITREEWKKARQLSFRYGILSIDDDLIVCTGKTATQFTGCQRGAFATVAAQHTSGATVRTNMVSAYIKALQEAVVAIEQELGTAISRNYVRKDGAVTMTGTKTFVDGAEFGSGNKVATGLVRLPNSGAVKRRKADGSGDLGLALDANDRLVADAIIDFAPGQTFGAFSYPDAGYGNKGIVQIDAAGGLAVESGVLWMRRQACRLVRIRRSRSMPRAV